MSKGKGDSQESQIKLPPEIEALAKRNLAAAEKAGQIGYVPYEGPTVAALNPMQTGAMQGNADAMRAFGLAPANVAGAIPKPTTYAGGVQGYSPFDLYTQAKGKISPHQAAQIESFVSQPGPATVKRVAAAAAALGTPGAPRTVRGPAAARRVQELNRTRKWDWNINGGMGGYVYR